MSRDTFSNSLLSTLSAQTKKLSTYISKKQHIESTVDVPETELDNCDEDNLTNKSNMYNTSRKYSVDARPSTTAGYLRQVFKVH